MPAFSSGEMSIMKILWKHGSLNAVEIQERHPSPIKNAALRFALRTLVEKGHVLRKKKGRAYFYSAKTPQQGAFKTMVQRITDAFCNGSPVELIAQLMETEKLSPEDINYLETIVKNQSGRIKKGRGKKND